MNAPRPSVGISAPVFSLIEVEAGIVGCDDESRNQVEVGLSKV